MQYFFEGKVLLTLLFLAIGTATESIEAAQWRDGQSARDGANSCTC